MYLNYINCNLLYLKHIIKSAGFLNFDIFNKIQSNEGLYNYNTVSKNDFMVLSLYNQNTSKSMRWAQINIKSWYKTNKNKNK